MSDKEKPLGSNARRDFLKITGSAAAGFVAGGLISNKAGATATTSAAPATPAKHLPTRNLGKTGHRVGIFSLGGQAAIEHPNNEAVAVPLVERAIDLGVNYIDTAAQYGGSERWSQRYIGQVMKRRRNEVYLASKTHDRTREGSLELLHQSLTLLNTDHLDAWQLHHIDTMDEVERIFAKGGAIEALQQARDQKMVRFLGITGHNNPDVLMECIRRFPFDQILMAFNAADKHHLSFTEKLLPMAVEKQMGIIGMKIPARGRILSSWNPPAGGGGGWEGTAKRSGTLNMKEAMYYVLSQPVSTVIVGCDTIAQLEENVTLAREFTPLNDTQLASLTEKTAPIAQQALFFRRWS